jgi:DNA topoisomerase IB
MPIMCFCSLPNVKIGCVDPTGSVWVKIYDDKFEKFLKKFQKLQKLLKNLKLQKTLKKFNKFFKKLKKHHESQEQPQKEWEKVNEEILKYFQNDKICL